MTRQPLLERVRAAERHYRVAALSVGRFRAVARRVPAILRDQGLTVADLQECHRLLEATYLVRLFAEFEAALRSYWRHAKRRPTWNTIRAEVLINSVAAYQHMPEHVVAGAHCVRGLRNAAVHGPGPAAEMLALRQCCSFLCRFLSFLPARW